MPHAVRNALQRDYAQVRKMLDKLQHEHVHIAVFGRVSTGKSSVLNALLGQAHFSVSPLHGETTHAQMRSWEEGRVGGVFLIDTPGIDEINGEAREELARDVTERVDLVLFVADGDLTDPELEGLRFVTALGRPVLLVLNKADRYSAEQLQQLREAIIARTDGLVEPRNIIAASAHPPPQRYVQVDAQGSETELTREREPDIEPLRERLWEVLEHEGKTLAALNAGLFAGRLSEQVAQRVLAARQKLGEKLIHTYCVGKGIAVALNPIPAADLAAAAIADATMVYHMSKLYDLPITRTEAGSLVGAIIAQMAALMGAVWAVHLLSSALKLGTAGMSTALTAGAQGAVAYYSTYVVGKVAERYLVQGKSWGDGGPKLMVQEILDGLDRDSILADAREEIRAYMRGESSS